MNKALLIGINHYASQKSLAGCVNDVVDMQRLLVDQMAVERKDIVVLTDQHATAAAILKALRQLIAALEVGDRGYVHFSGHGARLQSTDPSEPDSMDEVLCPHDFNWTAETAVTDREVLAIVGRLQFGARLIISLDTCHIGDFMAGLRLRGRPRTLAPPAHVRSRGPTLRGFRSAVRNPDVTFLAACSVWQAAVDASFDDRPSGAFTHFLVEELTARTTASLADVIATIEKPLQDHGMTPVAENADLPYATAQATGQIAALATFASPLRSTSMVGAGPMMFQHRWQTWMMDQLVDVEVRIAMANGDLTAFVMARAFGKPMSSPPIRLTGNRAIPIQLAFFGLQLTMTVSDWTVDGDNIDFAVQLELARTLAFIPRIELERVRVSIPAARAIQGGGASRCQRVDARH
jgi:metacaspase-1